MAWEGCEGHKRKGQGKEGNLGMVRGTLAGATQSRLISSCTWRPKSLVHTKDTNKQNKL